MLSADTLAVAPFNYLVASPGTDMSVILDYAEMDSAKVDVYDKSGGSRPPGNVYLQD